MGLKKILRIEAADADSLWPVKTALGDISGLKIK